MTRIPSANPITTQAIRNGELVITHVLDLFEVERTPEHDEHGNVAHFVVTYRDGRGRFFVCRVDHNGDAWHINEAGTSGKDAAAMHANLAIPHPACIHHNEGPCSACGRGE